MRKRRASSEQEDPLYDLEHDAVLIEQSLAAQYGVLPAAQRALPWPDWAKLVAGLLPETPLGRVIAARAERDPERLRAMGPAAEREHRAWNRFLGARKARAAQQNPEAARRAMAGLQASLAALFGTQEPPERRNVHGTNR